MRLAPLLIFLFFVASTSVAGQVLDQTPGFIPLLPGTLKAASDLDYQGKRLSPNDAEHLTRTMDISALEPMRDTEVFPSAAHPIETVTIDPALPLDYVADEAARTLNFRFSVTQQDPSSGEARNFTLMVSKTIHNILIRKALLEKLGYVVPPVTRLSHCKIRFQNPIARELFLDRLGESTLGDPKRWATPSGESELELQDVIAMNSQSPIYNLSLGYLPASVIRDLRIFRALAIAYELTNVPESVNSLDWSFAHVVSEHLKLSFQDAEEFTGNYEDARWLARKIGVLSREDWAQIVAAGGYPLPVQKLLVEKLISRRDDLQHIFKIKASDIAFDPKVSSPPDLASGKLSHDQWPGYGSRFAFTDPESPFSGTELFSFLKQKTYTNLLSNGIDYLNNNVIPTVDVQNAIEHKQIRALAKQFANFLKTGKVQKIPLQAWAIPVPGIQLIASRDVVVGSYLGSDNKVQLADEVGFAVNIGAMVETLGIPSPWSVSGLVNASVRRTYVHLRPIATVKASLQYPFKNIIVPLVQSDWANAAGTLSVDSLKDQLQIGESLIITESIGGEAAVQVGAGITPYVGANVGLSGQELIVSRTHILRESENKIHIYRDFGNLSGLQLSLGLNAYIPVITISGSTTDGSARQAFYTISLDGDQASNPDLAYNLQGLRSVLLFGDFDLLDSKQTPLLLTSRFSQERDDFSFLFFRHADLSTNILMDVDQRDPRTLPVAPSGSGDADHASLLRQALSYFFQFDSVPVPAPATPARGGGKHIELIRAESGTMSGNDFQSLFLNVTNAVISDFAKAPDFYVDTIQDGRPADSLGGSSIVKNASLDAVVLPTGLGTPFLKIDTHWAGWEISRDDTEDIVREISKRLGVDVFPTNFLGNTQSIQLYDIELYYNIYEEGIARLLSLSEDEIRQTFEKYHTTPLDYQRPNPQGKGIIRASIVSDFNKILKQARDAKAKGDLESQTQEILKLGTLVENDLSKEGVFAILGGEQNALIGARISGFREGDESGDTPLLSNTLGQFGSPKINGPIEQVRSNIDASSGEFYLMWILSTL